MKLRFHSHRVRYELVEIQYRIRLCSPDSQHSYVTFLRGLQVRKPQIQLGLARPGTWVICHFGFVRL